MVNCLGAYSVFITIHLLIFQMFLIFVWDNIYYRFWLTRLYKLRKSFIYMFYLRETTNSNDLTKHGSEGLHLSDENFGHFGSVDGSNCNKNTCREGDVTKPIVVKNVFGSYNNLNCVKNVSLDVSNGKYNKFKLVHILLAC